MPLYFWFRYPESKNTLCFFEQKQQMATFLLHNPYNLGLEEAEREGELQETLSEAGVI